MPLNIVLWHVVMISWCFITWMDHDLYNRFLTAGHFNHFQFSIITPHDPVCELMRVSDDFRKGEEIPQWGTMESKRVSVWKGLGNTVRQSSGEVVPMFSHLTGTESLRFPTSKPSFIIIFSNSKWGTESCNWFDYCFFDPYLSWTNFHMLISHFTLFCFCLNTGELCVFLPFRLSLSR